MVSLVRGRPTPRQPDCVFKTEENGTIRIPKGTQIGCGICHENELTGFALGGLPARD